MDRRRSPEHDLEILDGLGDHGLRSQLFTEPVLEELWAVEGALHGKLLVEKHA